MAWYLVNAAVSCEACRELANMSADAEVLAIKDSGSGEEDDELEEEGETAHCFPLLDGNVAEVMVLCPFA